MDRRTVMLTLLLLVMAQNVPGPPSDDVTLPTLTRKRDCRREGSDEIVVCASSDESDRLRPLEPQPVRSRIPRARIALSERAAASADAENRGEWLGVGLMARLKIDF